VTGFSPCHGESTNTLSGNILTLSVNLTTFIVIFVHPKSDYSWMGNGREVVNGATGQGSEGAAWIKDAAG
jgi:hypothetical protein